MIDNANPQELINLLRTFIGDTQIVRAARAAADMLEELSTCKLCRSTGHDTPCAYPTEINRQQAKRIAELEARSATPYCHIYEYDHGYFGLHRQFSPTEWNGMKPTRVVAVFTAPVADSAMAKDAWQPIETAPKDRVIMLWVPTFSMWIAGPWRGAWSYVAREWVLHTPITNPDGRAVTISGIPHPTHWMPLPPAPAIAASAERSE